MAWSDFYLDGKVMYNRYNRWRTNEIVGNLALTWETPYFFLLEQFKKWDASIVFCGHVHKWDVQRVGITDYLTLDSMSERNNPEPG